MLVFAQQIDKIVRLTWDDVTVSDDMITVRLGSLDIALPAPLDEPWRLLAASTEHTQTAAHPASNWVFRGLSPGSHIHAMSLRARLTQVFGARAARLGTLEELSKLAPVAVIAEALGYHPATIERHAWTAAAGYAQYVAAVSTSST